MKVKCQSCGAVVDSKDIEDVGGTGNKDVMEMWDDGSVGHFDFIGECPKCNTDKSLFNKVEDEKPVLREVNLKLKKIGIVHYFGMTYPKVKQPEPCSDCGEQVTKYTLVMGGKRDETNKPVWKVVCDKCVEAYKSEDLDMPVTSKLGEYKGHSVSRITKEYKPYTRKCVGCKEEFDIQKVPLYNIIEGTDLKTYCRYCFISVVGADPVNLPEKE